MLISLIDAINKYAPNAKFCVSPLLENREQLKELNTKILSYPLFHYGDKKYFALGMRFPFLIKQLLKVKGINAEGDIALKDIDTVFDISGFAFGEKWGGSPLKNLAFFVKKMNKQGTKFYLLPQAFGPFPSSEMAENVRQVVQNSELVMARDKQSYEFVQSTLLAPTEKVVLFPDITLTFKSSIPISDKEFANPFCTVVPNERMLDKASINWQQNYIEVISKIVRIVIDKSDLNVIILIHAQGGSKDREVGQEILNRVLPDSSERAFIYVEEDPARLKSIISRSAFLVGSRFHALASALSSNTPALATSWLHKYEMLFQDYHCDDYSFKEPDEEIYSRVESLVSEEKRQELRRVLESVNNEVESKSKEMWQSVFGV